MESAIVRISVGKAPDIVDFSVHKDLLCHYSTYFRAAYNSAFSEVKSNHFKLDDEDPSIFKFLVRWIYFLKIEPEAVNGADVDGKEDEFRHLYARQMTQLWILGDKRGMPALQDTALESLHRHMVRHGGARSTISLIYNNTLDGAVLRKFIAETYARCQRGESKHFADYDPSIMIPEFLADVCTALIAVRDEGHGVYIHWKTMELSKFHVVGQTSSPDTAKTVSSYHLSRGPRGHRGQPQRPTS